MHELMQMPEPSPMPTVPDGPAPGGPEIPPSPEPHAPSDPVSPQA